MNLLVLGNGFDLAHDMPTRYSDFLWFIAQCINQTNSPDDFDDLSQELSEIKILGKFHLIDYFFNTSQDTQKFIPWICRKIVSKPNKSVSGFMNLKADTVNFFKIGSIKSLVMNNIWLDYFLVIYESLVSKGVDWVDLENELTDVIEYKLKYYTGNDFYDQMYLQLKMLGDILEEYLCMIQNKNIPTKFDFAKVLPESESIDTVLNFNYTNTYAKLYDPNANIDYINGKTNSYLQGNIQLESAIILGIHNSAPDKIENYCNTNAHLFFKYYQRVEIDSSCCTQTQPLRAIYKSWISVNQFQYDKRYIQNNNNTNMMDQIETARTMASRKANRATLKIFIIGHSLDITDKQILKEVILSPQAEEVTIYYYNEKDRLDKLRNLLKVLGEKEFIEHVHSLNKAKPYIQFKQLSCIEKMVSN